MFAETTGAGPGRITGIWLGLAAVIFIGRPTLVSAEGAFHVAIDGRVRANAVRATDDTLTHPRRVSQHLGLSGWSRRTGSSMVLSTQVRLRLDSELGLDAGQLGRLDERADEFVDPSLELAYVQATQVAGLLDASLGRHLVLAPTGLADLDGATLILETPTGMSVKTYGGLDVREHSWLGDDPFDAAAPSRSNPHYDERALIGGWVVGYTGRELSVRIGYERRQGASSVTPRSGEPTADTLGQIPLRSERMAVALNSHALNRFRLDGDATYNLAFAELDRAALDATLEFGDNVDAGLGLELSVPRFELDSVFNVFGARPTTTWRGRADTRWDLGGPTLSPAAALTWRAYGDPLGDAAPVPGTASSDRDAVGAEISAGLATARAEREWLASGVGSLRLMAETGLGDALFVADLTGTAEVVRSYTWVSLRALAGHSSSAVSPRDDGEFAAVRANLRHRTEQFGHISVVVEERATPRLTHELRLAVAYNLDLDLLR